MIPGLSLFEDFITPQVETQLTADIDSLPWDDSLHRRVQQYGPRYVHRTGSMAGDGLRPIPTCLQALIARLGAIMGEVPNQIIINEYLQGQGIAKHIDSPEFFGEVIASLSLLSGAMMRFDDLGPPEIRKRHELYLQPRSLLVLRDEARSQWRHEVPKRSADPVGKSMIERSRRISVTFRQARVQAS